MRFAFTVIALAAVLLGGAAAQTGDQLAREREIAASARQLDELTDDLHSEGVKDPAIFDSDLRSMIAAARVRLTPVEAELKRAEDRLALLGAPPKEGEPAEALPVAREREAINSEVTYLRGQRTRIIANIDEAAALLDEFSAQRLGERYRRLSRRGASLVSFTLWDEASAQARDRMQSAATHVAEWSALKRSQRDLLFSIGGLLASLAASFMMFGPVSNWLRRVFGARIEAFEPTPRRRVAVAGIKMLTRLIPGVVGGLLVIETSKALGLIVASDVPVVRAIWKALVAYLVIDGFARGLLSPLAPSWRIEEGRLARAKVVFSLVLWIVIAGGAKAVFAMLLPDQAQALRAVVNGSSAMIVGALMFALCRKEIWVPSAAEASAIAEASAGDAAAPAAPEQGPWGAFRFFGRLVSFAMLIAPVAGFVAFADFAATRLYYLILLSVIIWFVRAALKEMLSWADRRMRTNRTAADEDGPQAFQFWIGAGIDFVILLSMTPILFVMAGVNASIVRDYLTRALIGFRIGGFTISLVDVLMSIGTFVGILALTRLFQTAMQRGPFAHSRIDPGIQNSLTTLIGYAGLVIAAFAGLGLLGVDLSNLALIAGALSVGIGFGLQSIVNNFVSGIILLFERPVKVGDWIVTPSGEGIVKKISVRSTVLETFERASVIIPNSELVASSVTNWTHKSSIGRISVAVGVAYDSDPELVRTVLLRCANAHPLIVRYPEAFVVWHDFADSSLNFEVRGFISDISKGLQVRTDLRYAIFKAFKEEGIGFPFPTRDINIKSFPADAPRKQARAFPASSESAAPPNEPDDAGATEK